MKIRDLIKHLETYELDDEIAYDLWSVDDVLFSTHNYGTVTQEQAEEVLRRMDDNKDCNVGLNWDVLNYHLSNVMEEADNLITNPKS